MSTRVKISGGWYNSIKKEGAPATALTGPNAGKTSINNYVAREGGTSDIRILSDDTRWINGNMNTSVEKRLPAARDLAGTSGQTLTIAEFLNDDLVSGGISLWEYCKNSYLLIASGRLTDTTREKLFDISKPVTITFQNGHVSDLYITPLGAYLGNASAFDAPEQIIGPNGRLRIPRGVDLYLPGLGVPGQPIDFMESGSSLLKSLELRGLDFNDNFPLVTLAGID